jgi:hypothetical protein
VEVRVKDMYVLISVASEMRKFTTKLPFVVQGGYVASASQLGVQRQWDSNGVKMATNGSLDTNYSCFHRRHSLYCFLSSLIHLKNLLSRDATSTTNCSSDIPIHSATAS